MDKASFEEVEAEFNVIFNEYLKRHEEQSEYDGKALWDPFNESVTALFKRTGWDDLEFFDKLMDRAIAAAEVDMMGGPGSSDLTPDFNDGE